MKICMVLWASHHCCEGGVGKGVFAPGIRIFLF